MRIVLCATPAFPSEAPPLGLAYLKAGLVRDGHTVTCLDLSKGYDDPITPQGPSRSVDALLARDAPVVSSWVERIEALQPDLVGITLWISTRETAKLLASALRRRLPRVVLLGGGPDFLPHNRREYLDCFDYVIENEGDLAIRRFVAEHAREGTVSKAEGVWYRAGSEPRLTAPKGRIENLDELPYPDFSDFDVVSSPVGIPVMFSRGCNANCTFCTNKRYFRKQVSRTGASMYREISAHVERTGCRRFIFADDSLLSASNLEEFMTFCTLVRKRRMDIRWRIYAQRIIPALKRKHVRNMRKAGLETITFGVESFSENVRRDMGKTASDVVTERVLRDFLDRGIQVSLLMIYGYPAETEEDFEKTLQWIQKNGNAFSHICFSCFAVTEEYVKRRPGVVTFHEGPCHPYKWHSEHVDLETRKRRFLRLAEALEALRVGYMISDPHLEGFRSSWSPELRADFEEKWTASA